MDLSALGSTLPPGLEDAEQEMGNKFRAAAMSITHLYKTSLGYTKQAYQVGYSAALADVLSHVQGSMSAGQTPDQTLARMLDWAEARQTAMDAFAAEAEDDQLSRPPSSKPVHRTHSNIVNAHAHASASNRPASAPPIASPTGAGIGGSIGMSRPAAASASGAQGRPGQMQGHTHAGASRLGGREMEKEAGKERMEDMRHREQAQSHAPSSSAGPSSPIRPDRGRAQETHIGGGELDRMESGAGGMHTDPDRTFVHSTPASTSPYSPRSSAAHSLNLHTHAHPHLHADSNGSPVPIVRQPRPSRSPLRHRSDLHSENAIKASAQTHPQTTFNPTLPPLQQMSFPSTSVPSATHDTRGVPDSPLVPIGTKRAAPFDADLDLDMDMDGEPGNALSTADTNNSDTSNNTTTNTHRQLPVSVPLPMSVPVAMPLPPVTPTNNRQGARKRRNLQGGDKGDEGVRKGKKGGL